MWPFGSSTSDEKVLARWGPRWGTFGVEGTGQRKDADVQCAKVLERAARTVEFPVFIVQHRPYELTPDGGWYHGTVSVAIYWPAGQNVDALLAARHETGTVIDYLQFLVGFMNRQITEPHEVTGLNDYYWWAGRDKTAKVRRVNMHKRPA